MRRSLSDDRGAGYVAAFIVLFATLALAGVGILVDTVRIVSAHRQCDSIALEAARAGANALDVDAVRAGDVVLDGAAAQSAAGAAAAAFVSSTGARLVDVSVDGTRVSVRVVATVDPWFPVMAARTVAATASATATVGP